VAGKSRKGEGRRRRRDKAAAADSLAAGPLPGTAGMAQGQPEAGVEPAEPSPGQPDKGVTGPEALAEQQTDPELDDTSGGHP
jgi:hypothetical protein